MNTALISGLMDKTLALILAGGRGTRLKNLTQHRAKPAVPFGGNCRIIDFAISNCANSGIRRIGVVTQYEPRLLVSHVQKLGMLLHDQFAGNLALFPVEPGENVCYSGTADAVYRNLDMVRRHEPDFIVILAGDHVYKMDYAPMLAFHMENQAALTVGCIKVPVAQAAGAFGVMGVDRQNRVTGFNEKPARPEAIPGQPGLALASTGIYIFNTRFLIEQLNNDAACGDSTHDFGKDIIPAALAGDHAVHAYPFLNKNGENLYWRDVGTVDAYWQASMELLDSTHVDGVMDSKEWPLWTLGRKTVGDRQAYGSCFPDLPDTFVSRSLLFDGISIGTESHVRNSVVLPNVTIGRYCHVENAVIDEGVCIPDFTVIGKDPVSDSRRFHVSEKGVVLVTPDMLDTKTTLSREAASENSRLQVATLQVRPATPQQSVLKPAGNPARFNP